MSYTERPITPELLDAFWSQLWGRGLVEFARLGLTPPMARSMIERFVRDGESGALCADDAPVAIMGLQRTGIEYATWFQATDDFDRHARAITKWIRRELNKRGNRITIYSVCVHPDTARWFGVLGFRPDGWEGRTPPGHKLIRFVRSAKEMAQCA